MMNKIQSMMTSSVYCGRGLITGPNPDPIGKGWNLETLLKMVAAFLCILGTLVFATADSLAQTSVVKASTRIAMARVYQQGDWTLPAETPETVGQALAQRNPTWVSGLIRLGAGQSLSQEQIDAFVTITALVLAANPDCKFDFVLNAGQYSSAQDMLQQMEDINSKIKVDIWFFEGYQKTYKKHPDMIQAAIDYAHSLGQVIGGDALRTRVPSGSDYAAVADKNFHLKKHQIHRIAQRYHIPVVCYINGDTHSSEPRNFIKKWVTGQRVGYITQLSVDQNPWGYQLMYPIFWPMYPAGRAYDSLQDNSILPIILDLMNTYN
jgi:hypothetical protein